MNTNTNDGGPAFPTQNGTRNDPGMTLRDWFAGMALQGMIAGGNSNAVRLLESSFDTYGEAAYSAADEMLAARNGKGEE